jgi:hypothetical protein
MFLFELLLGQDVDQLRARCRQGLDLRSVHLDSSQLLVYAARLSLTARAEVEAAPKIRSM